MGAPSIEGLTQPIADTGVLRAVLNQHWRVLLQDFLSLATIDLAQSLHGRVTATVQSLLKTNPRRVVRVLRRPTIAGLVGAIRRRSAGQRKTPEVIRLLRELDLLILSELAAQGDLADEHVVSPEESEWPVLRSLEARVAVKPPPGTTLKFSNGHIVAEGKGVTTELLVPSDAYVDLGGGILFGSTDNNPLLSVQAHPDRPGNTVDLGGHPASEWVDTLKAALALVEQYQPLIAEEMRLALELVVPVGYDAEKHFSVSYEEAVGAIYMTLHPSVITMAEALIHEFQHNKLNAVFRWDPVLHNAHAPLYTSPVRPDPRPLHGIVMAVHAFQPIAKLYERMTDAADPLSLGRDWQKRFKQIVDINREGAETVLKNGRPTELGSGLVKEITALDAYYSDYAARHFNAAEEAK